MSTTPNNLILKTAQQFTFEQVQTFISYLTQAYPNIIPNLRTGDPSLALFEAQSAELLDLQAVLLRVALLTRLSTSGAGAGLSGSSGDVDSFVNDFGLYRLPATYDVGQETFSTSSPKSYAVNIPVGTVVQDPTGQYLYSVIADTTNSAYSASLNAYVLPVNQTSVNVTVQAQTAGTVSNVSANTLVVLTTPVPGISTVTNPNPIDNAVNQESDASLKARFVQYIASLSRATSQALDFAISGVSGVVRWVKLENTNPAGQTQDGFFTIYVDDGTGSPPSSLITNVNNAVNAYRGFTIQFAVEPPNTQLMTIDVTVTHNPNTSLTNAQIASNIQAALINFINTLNFGSTVYFSQLYDIIWDAAQSPVGTYTNQSILTVNSLTLNGSTSDAVLGASYVGTATSASVTVTVN